MHSIVPANAMEYLEPITMDDVSQAYNQTVRLEAVNGP